ncbi:hypothetical protein GGX14DRAFT_376785, partial [Mycena pura]
MSNQCECVFLLSYAVHHHSPHIRKKCSSACPSHCPVLEEFQVPASPCSELLVTNSVPPDVQINEIQCFIGSAEAKISIIDDQIAQMQYTLDRLGSQRVQLQNLVQSHRSVVSTMRRLPTDILGEIFSQLLSASRPPVHSPEALSHLVGVCKRWRTIALASPLLW